MLKYSTMTLIVRLVIFEVIGTKMLRLLSLTSGLFDGASDLEQEILRKGSSVFRDTRDGLFYAENKVKFLNGDMIIYTSI
jgi:hypothetical protein